jgi:anthranilate/para-aminobenzoate synthase component II
MTRTNRHQAQSRHSHIRSQTRKATVVHDGSAFQLAADLRQYGFDVSEGPLFSSMRLHEEAGNLAVIATRPGAAKSDRLLEWARELCWRGAAVLAIGAAVGPVAELFGTVRASAGESRVSARLADIQSASLGLFAGLPSEFRLALPAGHRFETTELSAEFSTTAWSRDGELIGASHIFRPVHLLHPAALDSRELRPVLLKNLITLLRERGGRAF